MSHDIESDDTIAAFGKTWHGKEILLDRPQTWKEMMVSAKLGWQVKLHPVSVEVKGFGFVESPDHNAVIRMSDGKCLGIVGSKYQPIQNEDAGRFLDELPLVGAMAYHTAGSLKGGRQVFILGKLTGQEFEVVPGDLTDCYILAVNTHDGTGSFRVLVTTTRVVCGNTLRIALSAGAGTGLAIRHLGNVRRHLEEAQRVLGFATKEVVKYKEMCDYLQGIKYTPKKTESFIESLLPATKVKDPDSGKRVENVSGKVKVQREKILELVESGKGSDIPGVRGTGYGVLQAVTEYTSHYLTVRGSKDGTAAEREQKQAELRQQGAWLGAGDRLNQKAQKLLLPKRKALVPA